MVMILLVIGPILTIKGKIDNYGHITNNNTNNYQLYSYYHYLHLKVDNGNKNTNNWW